MESKIVLGLNLVALLIGFVLGYLIYEPQLQPLQSQFADLQNQVADLQSQNDELQNQIDILEQRLRGPKIGPVTQIPNSPYLMGEVVVTATVIDIDGVSQVILSYKVSGGKWNNLTMENIGGDNYEATIPAFMPNNVVDYQIIAYDIPGDAAVEDNAGSYYHYVTIPEFTSTVILPLLLIFSTLTVIVLAKKHIR